MQIFSRRQVLQEEVIPMSHDTFMTAIMVMSIGFQLAAAYLAIRLIKLSGVVAAWSLVAFGLIVMAARRGMILVFLILHTPVSSMAFEILGLIISILMFTGILLIKPLFLRIRKHQEDLINHQRELSELNARLEERVAAAVEENLEKDRLLMMKGREAAMGEMVRNIAHQWKQPLNSLGLTIQEMQYGFLDRTISEDDLEKSAEQSMAIIKHMSQTIDDFSNFFNPKKQISEFSLESRVLLAESFVHALLIKNGISIRLDTEEDATLSGPGSELVQVFMNLFQNAAEAFAETDITDKQIHVRISSMNGRPTVTVRDNAGGIKPEMIKTLFDAYSTSKKGGSGIGLYMSRMIVRKSFNGDITVANTNYGAEFRIEL